MSERPLPRVLCVDDDPRVLAAFRRGLRRFFEIETAADGPAGLARLAEAVFPVACADLRMPGMDGVAFLRRAREVSPDTVAVVLTGHTDPAALARTVNEGRAYRLLIKPCNPEELLRALRDAADEHLLRRAHRRALEQTARGVVSSFGRLLELAHPDAWARAKRIREGVGVLARRLGLEDPWTAEAAALLSQAGVISLSQETARRLSLGESVDAAEADRVAMVGRLSAALLEGIPPLAGVRAVLNELAAEAAEGATAAPENGRSLAARVLRVVQDLDQLIGAGHTFDEALAALRARPERYDPTVLATQERLLREVAAQRARELSPEAEAAAREVGVGELWVGMVLAADVQSKDGILLVPRGYTITPRLLARLKTFVEHGQVREPLRVVLPGDERTPASSEDGAPPAGSEHARPDPGSTPPADAPQSP